MAPANVGSPASQLPFPFTSKNTCPKTAPGPPTEVGVQVAVGVSGPGVFVTVGVRVGVNV